MTSVAVRGKTYPLSATIGPIPHTMKGRGITKDEAARYAYRDVIVASGAKIVLTLTQDLVVTR